MKKILSVSLLLSVMTFFSCSRSIDVTEQNSPSVNFFNRQTDVVIQKLIYNQLSAGDKFLLWKSHFAQILSNDTLKSNQVRFNLVNELAKQTTIKLFENDSQEAVVFLNYFYPQWLKSA